MNYALLSQAYGDTYMSRNFTPEYNTKIGQNHAYEDIVVNDTELNTCNNVFAHLRTCQTCSLKLQSIIAQKVAHPSKNILDSLFNFAPDNILLCAILILCLFLCFQSLFVRKF